MGLLSMVRSRSEVEGGGSLSVLRAEERKLLKESARVLNMLMPVENSEGMRTRRSDHDH